METKPKAYNCKVILPEKVVTAQEILNIAKQSLAITSQMLDDGEMTLYEAKERTKIAREMIRAAITDIMLNNPQSLLEAKNKENVLQNP